MPTEKYCSGFVAVAGRPNTGKSTLINTLLNEKISIVTPKPQTTRHSIMGILTRPDHQIVFVDTPGLHQSGGRQINRVLNRSAGASVAGADLVLLLVEATGWRDGDDFALRRAQETAVPIVLVVNKIDRVKSRTQLLPFLDECAARADFLAMIPVSALTGENLERLLALVHEQLPAGPQLFPAAMTTDRGPEFRIAEVIREKLLMALREEVPYGLAVEVLQVEHRDDLMLVDVVIWVERDSHRGMVVGRGGEVLKQVGTAARVELEDILGQRLHLQTHVKVKENWRDSAVALRQLGYEESR
ncbi:MAG: GTPase Era [Gammaproteobacteria bacterium]|nr:GTPase Era [Gammaproteobacteria bacterium]